MVRCANRSGTTVNALGGSTCCETHHFPGGSLHAPYELLSPLAVGKVMIKATKWRGSSSEAGRTISSADRNLFKCALQNRQTLP